MKNSILLITGAVLSLFVFSITAKAQLVGQGTAENPYRIYSISDMEALAEIVNNSSSDNVISSFYGKYVRLENDLDYQQTEPTPIGVFSISDENSRYFRGIFDGNGKTIRNIRVNRPRSSYALFTNVEEGEIKNLTISDSYIHSWSGTAGLVMSASREKITNCHLASTVKIESEKSSAAGLIFAAGIYCRSTDCTNAADVKVLSDCVAAAGIVGAIGRTSSIIRCYNFGRIDGTPRVGLGAIVGSSDRFDYNNYTFYGGRCNVKGTGRYDEENLNDYDAKGQMHIGTILYDNGIAANLVSVENDWCYWCYLSTYIENSGNLYFQRYGNITLDISYTDTNAPEGYVPRVTYKADKAEMEQQGDYWVLKDMPIEDVTVSIDSKEYVRNIGYEPWVEANLNQAEFIYTGSAIAPQVTVYDNQSGSPVLLTEGEDYEISFSSAECKLIGTYSVIVKGIGNYGGKRTLSFSIVEPVGTWPGEGTAENPYVILTIDDMNLLASKVNAGQSYTGTHFRMENDLDYSGQSYQSINGVFNGTFDGNYHRFSNVIMSIGLFSQIGESATLRKIIVDGASIISGPNNIGGIVGTCTGGTIDDCYVKENVKINGTLYAGGIVGFLNGGNVRRCLNLAEVTVPTISNAGGVIGKTGNRENCEILDNYYAGACNVGGISNNDETDSDLMLIIMGTKRSIAMRGYKFIPDQGITIVRHSYSDYLPFLPGLEFEGNIYGGQGENIRLHCYAKPGFRASQFTANGSILNSRYTVGSEDIRVSATDLALLLRDDNTDAYTNEQRLTDNEGFTTNVVLEGRTLVAGMWNSLWLPFDLTAEMIAACPLAGATIRTLDTYEVNGSNVTLRFADISTILGGAPCIVRFEGDNIVEPVFSGVTIKPIDDCRSNYVEKNEARFVGSWYPVTLTAGNTRQLFLGANNKIYYPNSDATVNPFRGFFILGSDVPTSSEARIVVDFGDEMPSGIESVEGNPSAGGQHYYSLDGRKLDGKPTKKGIYIVNGKKMIVQ